MKKVLFSVFAIVASFVSISLTSCSKEKELKETASPDEQMMSDGIVVLDSITWNGVNVTEFLIYSDDGIPTMELHATPTGNQTSIIRTSNAAKTFWAFKIKKFGSKSYGLSFINAGTSVFVGSETNKFPTTMNWLPTAIGQSAFSIEELTGTYELQGIPSHYILAQTIGSYIERVQLHFHTM